MRTRWLRFGLIPLTILASVRCDGSPTAPTNPYTGIWAGTIVDRFAGTGTLRLTIDQQRGFLLSGTWTSTFSNATYNQGGPLGGNVFGAPDSVTLDLIPTIPLTCSPDRIIPGTLYGIVTVSGGRMTGGYGVLGCTSGHGGTVDLTRQ